MSESLGGTGEATVTNALEGMALIQQPHATKLSPEWSHRSIKRLEVVCSRASSGQWLENQA